jgi:hypothetical protein
MSKKILLEEIQSVGIKKGYFLLSTEYKEIHKPLLWMCQYGHEFNKSFNDIKRGRHCAICGQHLGEQFTRYCFEKLLEVKFNKTRPSWLVGKNGNIIELDGYNEELQIAFEYQGEQHYRKNHIFSNKNQKVNDNIKKKILQEKNIILFIIPHTILLIDIPQYLKKTFSGIGLDFNDVPIYLNDYIPNMQNNNIIFFKNLCKERGGECLSNVYYNSDTKLKIKCEFGHEFFSRGGNLKKGHWCPTCGKLRRWHPEIEFSKPKKIYNTRFLLCASCGKYTKNYGFELCRKCYRNLPKNKEIGEKYSKQYKKLNKEKIVLENSKYRNKKRIIPKIEKECLSCKKTQILYSYKKMLCYKCYFGAKNGN